MDIMDKLIQFFEKYIFGILLILAGIGLLLLVFSGPGTSFWYYILGPVLIGWGLFLVFSKAK